MNRLLTLAYSGLFATGLAILPMSVHAQSASPDTKTAPAVMAPAGKTVAVTDGKTTPVPAVTATAATTPAATTPVGSHAAKDSKVAPVSGAKVGDGKPVTAPHVTTVPTAPAAKTGG